MKNYIGLAFILFSNFLTATEFNVENWLLWRTYETSLPFYSSLTIYPPVILYAEKGELRGSIATPYSFAGENNKLISEFLIVVTDNKSRSHFLKPKLESIGFVNDFGIGMSSLNSKLFNDGKVVVQLYKANTPYNRQALDDITNKDIERKIGIERALTSISIPMPKYNETWNIKARTTNNKDIDSIIASSDWSIFQIYSPNCGFCRKAIPRINTLNLKNNISVIGIAGPTNASDFNIHINKNSINYPFITYEGEYTESAILKAVGQVGFPSYIVLNRQREVIGIFVGNPALDNWLKDLDIK